MNSHARRYRKKNTFQLWQWILITHYWWNISNTSHNKLSWQEDHLRFCHSNTATGFLGFLISFHSVFPCEVIRKNTERHEKSAKNKWWWHSAVLKSLASSIRWLRRSEQSNGSHVVGMDGANMQMSWQVNVSERHRARGNCGFKKCYVLMGLLQAFI